MTERKKRMLLTRSALLGTLAAAAAIALGYAATADRENRRIAIVLTNHGALGDTGRPTGFYLSELTHPHKVFTEAGFGVDFISPKGGPAPKVGVRRDDSVNAAFLADLALMTRLDRTLPAGRINPADYAAIFFTGGHGGMWDLPEDENLQRLTSAIYEQGGIVGAVGHGPAGVVNVVLPGGRYLVESKEVNSFTNEEEAAMELTGVVPFLLESRLRERGGRFSAAPKFQEHVVVSERLVTGQNSTSAPGVAQAVVQLLKRHGTAPDQAQDHKQVTALRPARNE